MADSARLKRFIQLKIFDDKRSHDANSIENDLEHVEDVDLSRPIGNDGERRVSIYVKVFEDMIQSVFDGEEHLLTDEEWVPFSAIPKLSYNARYCLARLLLLKPNHWYSLSSFEKWKKEVGEGGIIPAMEELCQPIKSLETPESTPVTVKKEEGDNAGIIDLTCDSDDEDVKPNIKSLEAGPVAGPSKLPDEKVEEDPFQRILNANPDDLNLGYFCQDDSVMTLEELLNRLTVDQLKTLAKQNKCSPGFKPKKCDYIACLLKNGTTQRTLGFSPKPNTKGKGKGKAPDPYRQTQLPFGPKKPNKPVQQTLPFTVIGKVGNPTSQEIRLRKQVLNVLGRCFRLNYDFFKLVRRVHLIAFRCTEHPMKLMLPALLTRFKKRAYPDYKCGRDRDIWPTRNHLLEYEKALALESAVDDMAEAEAVAYGKANPKDRLATPAAGTSASARTPMKTPLKTPRSSSRLGVPDPPKFNDVPKEDPDDDAEFIPEDDDDSPSAIQPTKDTLTVQKSRKVVECLKAWLLRTWKIHLELKHDKNRPPSLQRFESGYIYTRLLHRALHSLASIKDFSTELGVIEDLLGQRVWLRGKRGKLYERRAIIQSNYLWKFADGPSKTEAQMRALKGVKEALQDDDTHLVLRPGLLRRVRRLEKQLNIPPEDRTHCEGELRKADEVIIKAKRIHHRASSLKVDTAGNVIKDKENTPSVDTYFNTGVNQETPVPEQTEAEQKKPSLRRKGKSVWEGRSSKEELSVEDRALQYYQDHGFRGFHAETSILTTIWVLVNWDIIFADVRGAFETPYQSAPLDIVDDSFYQSRKELFDQRLDDIRDGKAAEFLVRHDSRYRLRNAWAIGVDWDLKLPDLVEIVECLGGASLATISRLLCEDYVGRSSGVPDLIVWNNEKRICKFVEVKGPGDTPQENQKLWFDSLLGAGIQVEVCKVEDINDVKTEASTRKGRGGKTSALPSSKKRKQSAGRGKVPSSDDDGEMDYDKMDWGSDDELPQAARQRSAKRRRTTDPGPLVNHASPGPTPSKSASS